MLRKRALFNGIVLAAMVLNLFSAPVLAAPLPVPTLQGTTATLPVVAIHVSELTQALETMPATPPTPAGPGTSGFEWWPTSWHYFVMHESLKETLRSDGTPFVEVTDADISAGRLLNADGSPRYPIVISLASEAITDTEIVPLSSYVAAGGFLFVGSSAFTRRPDGTTRGDFALASEMGLNIVTPSLENWYQNGTFTKVIDHRLVSHIPSGTLAWRLPLTSEQIPMGVTGQHSPHQDQFAWQVSATGAEVIANGGSGPLLATKAYGAGQFVYYGVMQPLIGHGGYDVGMYSYVIFRKAIEWAFESANLPIVKLSPWQYPYDAAFVVRHDLENIPSLMQSVESSAQFEQSVGAKGDYFLCTGTLRAGSEDTQLSESQKTVAVAGLRSAVSLYGATIGSHNGGLGNPGATLLPTSYDYWHWGPDEALDTTPLGYTSGRAYAYTSIYTSFLDIEGWLTGLDNGRSGCGTANNCPRTWVAPYFNSTREESYDILAQLGVKTAGEQKLSLFPHWTLSTQTRGYRYPYLTLPLSDWYVGNDVAQSLEGHNTDSLHAAVDFYYDLGALVNFYDHQSSAEGITRDYVTYSLSKPRIWSTNYTGVYDWWALRSSVVVTPSYSQVDSTEIVSATVTGATDPDTAVEVVIPNWSSGSIGNVQVLLNGVLTDTTAYRTTNYGVKVKVGAAVSNVEVRYAPLARWVQTNWVGGPGQAIWSDETRFVSSTGIDQSVTGQVRLSPVTGGAILLSDDFTRPPAPFDWVIPTTNSTWPNGGAFNTQGGVLNTSTSAPNYYGFAYTNTVVMTDHSVEADIRFPQADTLGGGIFGRLNASNGQRYAAWIYPGGTPHITLIKFYDDWGSWNSPDGFASVNVPAVGSGWHHLKMTFIGDQIQVFYDGSTTPVINFTDPGTDHGLYTSGYAGVDFYADNNTYGPTYNNFVVRNSASDIVLNDDFDPLLHWIRQMGTWNVTGGVLLGSSTPITYAYVYTDTMWTDYSVEGRIQFPSGAFGGGIGGRVNPATGAHYGAWVYPGSNQLNLVKFRDWTTWSGTPMQLVSLSNVGTGWHTLTLAFEGNRIRVYYDGDRVIDVMDNDFDARPAYLNGGVSVDTWTPSPYSGSYAISADDIVVRSLAQYNSSGTLLSSAYDGGVGVQWQTIAWDAAAGGVTNARIRTRTADQVDQLSAAPWSAYYTTSGSQVTSENRRWIQYELELSTSDSSATPVFYEIRVDYIPGLPSSEADLQITKTDSPDPVTVGSSLTYTLVITNHGPLGATGVTLTDTLPTTATFASVTPSQGTCNGTSTVVCNLGSLTNGANAAVTLVVTPTMVGTLTNRATVTGNERDDNMTNNSATQSTVVNALNQAPVLGAIGNRSVAEGTALTFTAHATDGDVPAQTLTYSLVGAPSGAGINGSSGAFSWTPSEAQGPGVYTFTVRVTDNGAPPLSDEEQIVVTVTEVNQAPVAVNDVYNLDEDTVLTVTAPGVLGNDSDLDGNPLTAVLASGPAHGELALNSDGSFVYTPTLHYNGSDSFTYRASDGMADSNVATVTLGIVSAVIDHITLAPLSATIVAGQAQTYTVTAYDTHGTTRDVTAQVMFSITAGAGGSWTGNIYTSQRAGEWMVTALYGSKTATASLKVIPGAPRITVQASSATLIADSGMTAAITATIMDAFGNPFAGMTLSGNTSPSTLGSVGGLDPANSAGQSFGTWTAGNVAGVGTLSVGNGSITDTIAITLNNPAPVITALSPTTVTVGGPAFTLIVTGTGFVGDSTVYWNGSARATTFVNSGQLVAAILTSDIAASGRISVTVVNPAPGGGTSNTLFFTVVIRPPTVGDYKLYLPLVARNYASGPDLVVERITATSNSAQVVITNQGNAPVVDESWADLYVNPNPVPTGGNQTWNDGRTTQGIAWGVTLIALPLMPGGSLTLPYGDAYFWPSLSSYEAIPAGTAIYAQVDSANANTTYGAVLETHEILGEAYNNIAGPVLSTLNAIGNQPVDTQPPVANSSPPASSHLPPRRWSA